MPDQRGAPLSVVLTGANGHAKVSAVDLIVSMIPKCQAVQSQEQHLCADTKPTAPFLKYCTQKCASDASAVLADDPTPRVWLDG